MTSGQAFENISIIRLSAKKSTIHLQNSKRFSEDNKCVTDYFGENIHVAQ